MKRWHTVKETAELLKMTESAIYNQIKNERGIGAQFEIHKRTQIMVVNWDYLYRFWTAKEMVKSGGQK